jgi:hypothetical protein
MAVGTDIGKVYIGDQGKELATTFDKGYVDLLLATKAAAEEAKRKKKADSAAKTKENTPGDTWHFYQNELAQDIEGVLNEGAGIMANYGIDDLWTSTHPAAFQWRRKMEGLNKAKTNIDQYQKEYDKAIASIAVREDKYDPEYVSEVSTFPQTFDYATLKLGKTQFPVPKFINPGNLYSNFYVAESNRYQQTLDPGEPGSVEKASEIVKLYFTDPSRVHDANAARQMFEKLPKETQLIFADEARRSGLPEPWMAHARSNFLGNLDEDTLDLTTEAVKFAQEASYVVKESDIEDIAGVSKLSSKKKFADPSYPEAQAKSYFYQRDYLLDKPKELLQLGIDINKVPDRETRRTLAENSMAQLIRDNAEENSKYGLSREQGSGSGGIGVQEKLQNYDDWRPRLNSDDPVVANEAAKWLVDVSGMEGQKPISDAKVNQPTRATIHYKDPNIPDQRLEFGRSLSITYTDQKEADAARANVLKALYDPEELTLNQNEEDALNNAYPNKEDVQERAEARKRMLEEKNKAYLDYLKELKRRSTGNTVEYPLVGGEYEQVFKTLHGISARQKKELFKTTLDGPLPFEVDQNLPDIKPGAPKKQPLSLFEE